MIKLFNLAAKDSNLFDFCKSAGKEFWAKFGDYRNSIIIKSIQALKAFLK